MPFSPLVSEQKKARTVLIFIFISTIVLGLFVMPQPYSKAKNAVNGVLASKNITFRLPDFPTKPFRYGLDIAGGTSLTYRADLAGIQAIDQSSAMEGLRDVVERRVNMFGVQEPRVEIAKSGNERRLIVELAGVKDIHQAIQMIGQTPFLEFRIERPQEETKVILEKQKAGDSQAQNIDPYFAPTNLAGRYLKKSTVEIDKTTYQPMVSLQFDSEGTKLFAELTKNSVGKRIAIYIDGAPISAPVVREEITGGNAQISGQFTIQDAKTLSRNLNEGALPVPISLISQQSIGASLGADSFNKSVLAGLIGFGFIALFMIAYYRLGGVFSVIALGVYTPLVLFIFKIIPVTLTLSGIAGFILSIGMAVDANILILERIREEIRKGKDAMHAINEGFMRAWPSIRDSNMSTIITSIVLYELTTGIVRGFALTLLIGVLVSMFSAIFVSRTLILAFLGQKTINNKIWFRA